MSFFLSPQVVEWTLEILYESKILICGRSFPSICMVDQMSSCGCVWVLHYMLKNSEDQHVEDITSYYLRPDL